jgi:hypothetical protein
MSPYQKAVFDVLGSRAFVAGFGYQIVIAPSYRSTPLTPSYGNAWVFTTRANF